MAMPCLSLHDSGGVPGYVAVKSVYLCCASVFDSTVTSLTVL